MAPAYPTTPLTIWGTPEGHSQLEALIERKLGNQQKRFEEAMESFRQVMGEIQDLKKNIGTGLKWSPR